MTPSVPLRQLSERAAKHLVSLGAEPSDLYRALANNEAILQAWAEMAWGIRTRARTPRALRELMILRCAQVQDAGYQWRDHFVMALAAGVDPDQIHALSAWRSSDLFEDAVRAALALTDEMLEGKVSDDTLAELEKEFDAAERIELIVTAGFYCMVPRVLEALRLEHPRSGPLIE